MKKKYIICLTIIGLLIVSFLMLGTGYGVYRSFLDKYVKDSTTLDCFKVYYSTGTDLIEMTNIKPVINSEGEDKNPITVTITNICDTENELQIRINILNNTTVSTDALMIKTEGNIELETKQYNNLPNTKTTNEAAIKSKLIGTYTFKPNETIRANFKIWFDERKAPKIDEASILSASFELIDSEKSINMTLAEKIIDEANLTIKDMPDYNTPAQTEDGIYKYSNEQGDYYYYRGIVNNNYIKFANHLWRIVGVNPDNSIKIVLSNSIKNSTYSNYYNSMDYTGMKYIYNNVAVNNNINDELLNWYNDNIKAKGLDKYIVEYDYCNDSTYTKENYKTYFNSYNRLVNNRQPDSSCPTTSLDFGGKINQKIGLLTADEVSIAGGVYNTPNQSYYLYNGENFFTMSPAYYNGYHSYVMAVSNDGSLYTTETESVIGIRPVINLSSITTVSGNGTIDDPYIIDK